MSYLTTVIADTPLHYWRLADPGGLIVHDIGSSPVALTAGNFLGSLPYTGPNSDGGASFHTFHAAWIFQDQIALPTPYSLECWVWQTQQTPRNQCLVGLEASAVLTGLVLGVNSGGFPRLTSNGSALVSPTLLTKNAWHHLVAVHTGSARRLYVDAILKNSDAQVYAGGQSLLGIAAKAYDLSDWLEGAIAECAVYNYALSAGQVTNHFLAVDSASSRPVYKVNGTLDVVTGISVINAEKIDSIYDAVFTTYQNQP